MDKAKAREKMIGLIINAKRTDPETGSFTEWLADYLLDHGVTVPADDVPEALPENLRPAPAFRVGDRAWQTNGTDVFELKVKRLLYDCGHVAFDESAVGQTIFKTSTEAEAAMVKMKEVSDHG